MKHVHKTCLLTIILFNSVTTATEKVFAEISYGELIDKITILKIKSERITDPEKLKNIFTELTSLLATLQEKIGLNPQVNALMEELKTINETLWDIEDFIRLKERVKDFGDEFIQLARNVYITNDQRFAIKRKIDLLLGSAISEEKSYKPYA